MSFGKAGTMHDWTLNKDDILMWQAYTHGNCGICIESTVGNVIAALDPNAIKHYLICCC